MLQITVKFANRLYISTSEIHDSFSVTFVNATFLPSMNQIGKNRIPTNHRLEILNVPKKYQIEIPRQLNPDMSASEQFTRDLMLTVGGAGKEIMIGNFFLSLLLGTSL